MGERGRREGDGDGTSVVGVSMGGMIAQHVALTVPEVKGGEKGEGEGKREDGEGEKGREREGGEREER